MQDVMPLFILKVFFGFFAIMNPIANAPIFLGLVENFSESQKKQVAIKSVIWAFIIVSLFCLAGKIIFQIFGLSLPAFRIAGGLLVFYVGVELLQGGLSKIHSPTATNGNGVESASRIAVSPLAIPILAGPGTISTAMNFVADGSILRILITVGIFAVVCLLTLLMFIAGEKLLMFFGENIISVISRLMGLILAVIGTEMVIMGVYGAIKMYHQAG
jgi:multiple antibiotic resistance protein